MDKVKILGLPYQIVEKEIINNENVMGQILYHSQVIYLKKDLPREQKEKTLLHEIVHGVFEGLGELELSENEKLVHALATAFYLLIKDNDFSFMKEENK